MQTLFEINLLVEKNFFKSYEWYLAPQIGDKLSIDEKTIFIVEERLLPTTMSNRVVLLGKNCVNSKIFNNDTIRSI